MRAFSYALVCMYMYIAFAVLILPISANDNPVRIVHLSTENEAIDFLNTTQTKLLALYNQSHSQLQKLLYDLNQLDKFSEEGISEIGFLDSNMLNLENGQQVKAPSLILAKYDESISINQNRIEVLSNYLNETDQILEFINVVCMPLVANFDELMAYRLFKGYISNHLILFINGSHVNNEQILIEYAKHALYNKKEELYYERMFHIIFDVNQHPDEFLNMKASFGIENNDLKSPELFAVQISHGEMLKYKSYSDSITFDSIKEFVNSFRAKELNRFLISEDIPDNNNTIIQKLVGKTFHPTVIRSQDDYLVVLCDDFEDIYCKVLYKLVEYIGYKTNGLSPKQEFALNDEQVLRMSLMLKFANFNTKKNEVEGFIPDEKPQIMLFLRGKKSRPFVFPFEPKLRVFTAWINGNIAGFNMPLSDKEEEYFALNALTNEERQYIYGDDPEGYKTKVPIENIKSEVKKEEILYLGPAPIDFTKNVQNSKLNKKKSDEL